MNSNLSTNQPDNSNTMFGASQPGTSQTNPFTADLKGEFTSSFGTSTNAVSQIFKEGGFVSQGRTRYIIIGAVALVLAVVVGYFVLGTSDDVDEFDLPPATTQMQTPETKVSEVPAAEKAAPVEEAMPVTQAPATTEAAPQQTPMGSGAVSLVAPNDGARMSYDETQGPAEFSWEGDGGTILFSRDSSMSAVARRANTSRNSYSFHNPWPGKWYWRVETASGASEVRSFVVSPPARRNIQLTQPTAGGSLMGSGGTVAWTGDNKVASFRVELSNGDFANPSFRFGSANNTLAVQGVTPGQYQLRVGAYSEVAGRWEYTDPVTVTVQ